MADEKGKSEEGKPGETKEKAKAPEAKAPGADTDTKVTDEEVNEAAKAVKRLVSIGKLFSDEDEDESKEKLPEEIVDLQTAAEKVATVAMTEKSTETVRRIHNALGRILETDAGEEKDDEKDEKPQEIKLGPEAIEAIAKAMTDALEDLRTGQTVIQTTFKESFTMMTSEIATGLEGMATAFKEFVDRRIEELKSEVSGVSKATDERLGQLEKVAGGSQRITGSEPGIATGEQPPKQITKDSGGAAPSQGTESVWKGIFGSAPKKQLAARGR